MKPVTLSWEDYQAVSDAMAYARGVCRHYGHEPWANTARKAEKELGAAIDLLHRLMFAEAAS